MRRDSLSQLLSGPKLKAAPLSKITNPVAPELVHDADHRLMSRLTGAFCMVCGAFMMSSESVYLGVQRSRCALLQTSAYRHFYENHNFTLNAVISNS